MSKRLLSASLLAVNRKLPGTILSLPFSPTKLLAPLFLMLVLALASVKGYSQCNNKIYAEKNPDTTSTPGGGGPSGGATTSKVTDSMIVCINADGTVVNDQRFKITGDVAAPNGSIPATYAWHYTASLQRTSEVHPFPVAGGSTQQTDREPGNYNGQQLFEAFGKPGEGTDTYTQPGNAKLTYYLFRVLTTSEIGCIRDTSNKIRVHFYKQIVAPKPVAGVTNPDVLAPNQFSEGASRDTMSCAKRYITVKGIERGVDGSLWRHAWRLKATPALPAGVKVFITDTSKLETDVYISGNAPNGDKYNFDLQLVYVYMHSTPPCGPAYLEDTSGDKRITVLAKPTVSLVPVPSTPVCKESSEFAVNYTDLKPVGDKSPKNYNLYITDYGNTSARVGSAVVADTVNPALSNVVLPNTPIYVKFATSPMAKGFIKYDIEVVDASACISGRVSGQVEIIELKATAGPDTTICTATGTKLRGNSNKHITSTPSDHVTGKWEIQSTEPIGLTGTFSMLSAADSAATFTPAAVGKYNLRWTVSGPTNSGCSPVYDDVLVTSAPAPSAVILTKPQSTHAGSPSSVSLLAEKPKDPNTGMWEVVGGPRSGVTIDVPGSFDKAKLTIDKDATIGDIEVEWIVSSTIKPDNNACPPAKDTVKITILGESGVDAGPDQTICSPSSVEGKATLAASALKDGETGAWTIVSGPSGATFVAASKPNTVFTVTNFSEVYTLRWTVSNTSSGVPSVSDDVQLVFGAIPSANFSVTNEKESCAGTDAGINVNFTGTSPFAGEVYVEELVGGTPVPSTKKTIRYSGLTGSAGIFIRIPADSIPNKTNVSKTYRVSIDGSTIDDGGNCDGKGVGEGKISVRPLPKIAVIRSGDSCNNAELRVVVKDSVNAAGTFAYKFIAKSVAVKNETTTGSGSFGTPILFKPENCITIYEYTIETSGGGCATVATGKFFAGDTIAPTFTMKPKDVTVSCSAADSISALKAEKAMATDACITSPFAVDALSTVSTKAANAGECSYSNYTITKTFVAPDKCGNKATYKQVITVRDSIGPVFNKVQSALSSDLTINCGSPLALLLDSLSPSQPITITRDKVVLDTFFRHKGVAVKGILIAAATDACNTKPKADTLVHDFELFLSTAPSGTCLTKKYTIKYRVSDPCGNKSTDKYTQVITVADTTGPTLARKADGGVYWDPLTKRNIDTLTVTNADNCSALVPDYTTAFTAKDICSTPTITQEGILAGTTIYGYGISRNVFLKAVDSCGNVSKDSILVFIADKTAPVCAAQTKDKLKFELSSSGSVTVAASKVDNGSKDGCSNPLKYAISKGASTEVITEHKTELSFGCSEVGDQKVTLYVTDFAGNRASCAATVVISDTIRPRVVKCPDSKILYWDAGCTQSIPDFANDRSMVEFMDACGVKYTQNLAAGSIAGHSYPFPDPANPIINLVVTATDSSKNAVACTIKLELKDSTKPTIVNSPSNVALVRKLNKCYQAYQWTGPTVRDNCFNPDKKISPASKLVVTETIISASGSYFTTALDDETNLGQSRTIEIESSNYDNGLGMRYGHFALGTTEIQYEATDKAGNKSLIAKFFVTVTAPPIVVTKVISQPVNACEAGAKGSIVVTPMGGSTNLSFDTTVTYLTHPGQGIETANKDTINQVYSKGAPTGGADYVYSLDGGAYTTAKAASHTYSDLAGGMHNVKVKDACGQIAEVIFNIEAPGENSFRATATATAVGCHASNTATGAANGGTITVGVKDGKSPYVYQLSDAVGEFGNSAAFVPDSIFRNLAKGDYKVRVRDANSCVVEANAIVLATASAVGGTVSGTVKVPVGHTPAPVVTFTGTGGTAPYTFAYNVNSGANTTVGPNTVVQATQSTAVANVYNYRLVSVVDAKGCKQDFDPSPSAVVTVSNDPVPTAKADLTLAFKFLPTVSHGNQKITGAVVDVLNQSDVATSGPIRVTVTKDNKYTIKFTSVDTAFVGGLFPASNSRWTLDASPIGHYYFTTSEVIPAGGVLSFGFDGAIVPNNSNGVFSVSAAIDNKYSNHSDSNPLNNSDGETVAYYYK